MCQVPGIADGRYLISDELGSEMATGPVGCRCGGHAAHGTSRRALLAGSAKLLGGAALLSGLGARAATASAATFDPADASPTGDGVVFLGVNGGPLLNALHKQPSLALVINGRTYLVDLGGDTIQQLVAAGLAMDTVAHAFVTHHHSDHVAGLPALASLGWVQSPPLTRLDVWGPAPLAQMHRDMTSMWRVDIASREMLTTTATTWKAMLHTHEVRLGKTGIVRVMEDANVRVSATRVRHGADIKNAFAYRFDDKHAGRSVVFSGDTAPTDNLVKLAQDADLLVHEVLYVPGVDVILQAVDPKVRAAVRQQLLSTHTSTDDLPKVAKLANVRRLATCHYTPGFYPPSAFRAAIDQANQSVGFTGEIITPAELDVVRL